MDRPAGGRHVRRRVRQRPRPRGRRPAGATYRGNVFGGRLLAHAAASADTRNNVESVYLPPGTTGPLVGHGARHRRSADDGRARQRSDSTDQDFALVVSNADEQAGSACWHGTRSTMRPRRRRRRRARVGRAGAAAREQVLQRRASVPPRAVSGVLAAGGAAVGDAGGLGICRTCQRTRVGHRTRRRSRSRLANAATCGADVGATLTMSSSAGTQTMPLVIPTGGAGAGQTERLDAGAARRSPTTARPGSARRCSSRSAAGSRTST